MSVFKLTYFNAKAIGEGIRMIFAYSGKEFKDIRVDYNDWVGHLKKETPFGKLPILEVDGKIIHQSLAICRYLGKETNLGGNSNWENLEIDMVAETFSELREYVANCHLESNDELKKKKLNMLLNKTIPYYFERFDNIIKRNGGYLAAGKLSWVDFYFIGYSETLEAIVEENVYDKYPYISLHRKKLYSIPKVQDWISKRPISQY